MAHRPTRPALLLTALLAAGALAGCATDGAEPATAAKLPTEQYPLEVRDRPHEIRLAAHPTGLSRPQEEALADLADDWRAFGGGPILVQAPTRGGDAGSVHETSVGARDLLVALGVPASRVERVGYDPAGDAPAPIIVGFAAYEAVIPKCGTRWENLSATGKNRPMGNFGCAVTANMAAQIDNPGDIAGPREMTPADAQRRAAILDKYRKGETTSTARDAQASGTLSSVAGSN